MSASRRIAASSLAPMIAAVTLVFSTVPSLAKCASLPSSCGFPDETNTGPQPVRLQHVPRDVTSGPGWHWDSQLNFVRIDGTGIGPGETIQFQNFEVNAGIDVNAPNNHVMVRNNVIDFFSDTGAGVMYRSALSLGVENNDIGISAERLLANPGERLFVGVKSYDQNALGITVRGNNIHHVGIGIQVYEGLVTANYIHDIVYKANSNEHLNGILKNEGTRLLTISGNTVFNSHNQTSAIACTSEYYSIYQRNTVITGNLMAGGGYALYACQSDGRPPVMNITVTNNRFSRKYYPMGGAWGPVAGWCSTCTNAVWQDNVWDENDVSIPAPP